MGGAGERTAAAPKETSVWGKGEGGRKEIYGGPFVPGEATTRDKRTFCPGWWFYPGQKGLLGGPGKFPARGPPLVPGRSTTRDKRGCFPSFPPNVMFVFVSFGAAAVHSPAPPTARAQRPRAPPPSTSPPRAPASAAAVDVRHSGPGPVPPRLRRPGLHSARTSSSSPPPAASTARRRAATLSAARHRAASSPPRRPGPCRAPRFPRRPV